MSLNPNPSKKVQKVIFSRKGNNLLYPPLFFNNVDVGQIRSQKHLGIFLDFKLSFNEHLEKNFQKSTEASPYFENFNHCCLESLF